MAHHGEGQGDGWAGENRGQRCKRTLPSPEAAVTLSCPASYLSNALTCIETLDSYGEKMMFIHHEVLRQCQPLKGNELFSEGIFFLMSRIMFLQ